MGSIRDFIAGLNFNRIETYRFNHSRTDLCILKNNDYEITDIAGNQLPNGIFDENFHPNPSAELIRSTRDPELINNLKELFTSNSKPGPYAEKPLFKNAILFYNDDVLVSGINLGFKSGTLTTINHQILGLSKEEFQNFSDFINYRLQHITYEYAYYDGRPEKWREHHYPDSFYYNHVDDVYETIMGTSMLSKNGCRAKLEVVTNGKPISARQLARIDYVQYYSFDLRDRMFDMIFEFYKEMRRDYILPEIIDEPHNNLSFFLKLNTVTIPENDNDDIILSIANWDEEHGLYIRIHERNDKMEFQF